MLINAPFCPFCYWNIRSRADLRQTAGEAYSHCRRRGSVIFRNAVKCQMAENNMKNVRKIQYFCFFFVYYLRNIMVSSSCRADLIFLSDVISSVKQHLRGCLIHNLHICDDLFHNSVSIALVTFYCIFTPTFTSQPSVKTVFDIEVFFFQTRINRFV